MIRRPPKVPRPSPVPRVTTPDPAALRRGPLPRVGQDDGSGHRLVTFAYEAPEAEAVLLFANRLTDETHLDDTLLERDPGTDLWHATYRMGGAWRASYSFLVHRPGEQAPWASDGQISLRAALDRGKHDPRNAETCRNRAGTVQSVVSLPDAPAQPWLAPRPGVPTGALTAHDGPDGRRVWLYEPPGLGEDAVSDLVVVLDGEVWIGSQSLPTTLDNLHADAAVAPLRAVLVDSGGNQSRWSDLGDPDAGMGWLADGLLPWVTARRPVNRVVLAGQSLGGLVSLRAGLQRPDLVYAVVSASASLWLDDLSGELSRRAGRPGTGPRVHLAHGTQEWVLDAPHRALARSLRTAGVEVRAASYNGGHDYAWWRGDLATGLLWALQR